ncbi:MAG: hypothetical protein IIU98_06440 [Ruminococcus sp.]|nr:hypothetical protein [Ruminococcus sp.]
MEEFSLLHPQGAAYTVHTLTDEAVNDLSIDFLLENLTEKRSERGHLRALMTQVTDDPDVIRYRCDVFEDFLRFPKLRTVVCTLTLNLELFLHTQEHQIQPNRLL